MFLNRALINSGNALTTEDYKSSIRRPFCPSIHEETELRSTLLFTNLIYFRNILDAGEAAQPHEICC